MRYLAVIVRRLYWPHSQVRLAWRQSRAVRKFVVGNGHLARFNGGACAGGTVVWRPVSSATGRRVFAHATLWSRPPAPVALAWCTRMDLPPVFYSLAIQAVAFGVLIAFWREGDGREFAETFAYCSTIPLAVFIANLGVASVITLHRDSPGTPVLEVAARAIGGLLFGAIVLFPFVYPLLLLAVPSGLLTRAVVVALGRRSPSSGYDGTSPFRLSMRQLLVSTAFLAVAAWQLAEFVRHAAS